MAFKTFELDEIGPVTVYKRKGTRNVRLSVTHDGKVRVSIPTWLPYHTGVSYVQSKRSWLSNQLAIRTPTEHENGQAVGKAHVLYFQSGDSASIRTRVTADSIVVSHPDSYSYLDSEVQHAATKACIRALRQEAEALLPARLHDLATLHNFNYTSVSVKHLKSRWGSCDQNQNITLNLFLMQLPWNLIDYVLLHELTHTKIMQHGPTFWTAMEAFVPNLKHIRREIKEYKTTILR